MNIGRADTGKCTAAHTSRSADSSILIFELLLRSRFHQLWCLDTMGLLSISCIWPQQVDFFRILSFEMVTLLGLRWVIGKFDLALIYWNEVLVFVIIMLWKFLTKPVALAVACCRCLHAL